MASEHCMCADRIFMINICYRLKEKTGKHSENHSADKIFKVNGWVDYFPLPNSKVSFYRAHSIPIKARATAERGVRFLPTREFLPCLEPPGWPRGEDGALPPWVWNSHGLQQLHVLLVPTAAFHLVVQLENDFVFKLKKAERKSTATALGDGMLKPVHYFNQNGREDPSPSRFSAGTGNAE